MIRRMNNIVNILMYILIPSSKICVKTRNNLKEQTSQTESSCFINR